MTSGPLPLASVTMVKSIVSFRETHNVAIRERYENSAVPIDGRAPAVQLASNSPDRVWVVFSTSGACGDAVVITLHLHRSSRTVLTNRAPVSVLARR